MAITMTLAGILVLALTSQFVALARFKTALENKAEPSREAYIILNHMTHVLRFAKATSEPVTVPPSAPPSFDNVNFRLTADIEGGHIAQALLTTPNFTTCYYRRSDAEADKNYLYFSADGGITEQVISKYVTYFDAGVAVPGEIALKFIFSKGDTVTPVQTKIKVLGE